MGEVYKARDTRLDRIVAIKVLPAHFADDPDRRQRFEREARAVATLNHPNICDLHDVGEAAKPESTPSGPDSVRFLVMEHLEGQTLAERLVRGSLATPEVLRYAIEIIDALDHAHRRGLIHRDLKPGNIMLTGTGAKLLDFGVSKLQPSPGLPALATVSLHDVHITAEGAVLGTFPYMSPEQLEGREADVRSDIFAFGATVYEMATGRPAFQGTTAATLTGAILHTDPPPLSSLQPGAPPRLDRIISRCLAKDPDDRWQTARDLMLELKAISKDDAISVADHRRRMKLGLVVSATLAFLAIAAAIIFTIGDGRLAPPDDTTVRLAFSPPDEVLLADLVIGGPVTISPDGHRLTFVATARDGRQLLWVRPLESLAARPLPGTDGGAHPFWSPDGQFVGFFAQRKLKKIHVSGGPSETICDAVLPRGGTWSTDGVIVFSAGGGRELYRVPAGGGAATPVPADGLNNERHWPSFLPDGRHFVYFGRPQKHGIYVAAIDSANARLLLNDYVGVAYAPPGYLLVLRGSTRGGPAGTLLAYPFDPARVQITGEPMPVAERIRYESGLARGAFTVSGNGTLVYGDSDRSTTQLTWFDRSGEALANVGGAAAFGQPSLSPDEKTVAVERVDPVTQDQDLWLIDTPRNTPSRFTSQPNNITFMPIWSPDGARIVFASARGTPPNLYYKASTGLGRDELLFKSTSNNQPTDWSRDGRFIVYAGMDPKTQWDLWLMPMSGADVERKPVPFLQTEFNEHLGRVSPDGRWIAYVSDESGTNEVYVQTFPVSGAKRRISTSGGNEPKWRSDGRELFYLAADGRLRAVGVREGPRLEIGSPTPLFKTRMGPTRNFGYDVNYTVTGDGQRFLISTLTEGSQSSPTTTVILNWHAALSRR
jgi:serine/threonine protein kinase/Tol biopolymer transport system component